MKILFVIRDPPGFGGAERRLIEIGKRLVERGHVVHVLCGKTRPSLPDEEQLAGLHFNYIRLLPEILFQFERLSFYLSRYLFYFQSLFWARQIRRIAPDIIVDYVTPSPSMVYLIARWLGIPCLGEIMEYRGAREWREAADPISAILGFLSQNLLFRAFAYRRIITISQATSRQLSARGVWPGRISVVPMAISPADYPEPGSGCRDPYQLLLVGRLMLQKGHIHLLEALPAVASQIPRLHLKIVGAGPLQEDLEQKAAQLGIADRVQFTGLIPEDEKIAHLWQSGLFVMPSLQEGFGLVVLEAMACGLPVVAFDLPVFREILTPACGRLVPKGDTQALGRAIVELLQDEPLCRWIGAHNRSYVRRFDWGAAVARYERILLESLNR